jgi:hypothetical protein
VIAAFNAFFAPHLSHRSSVRFDFGQPGDGSARTELNDGDDLEPAAARGGQCVAWVERRRPDVDAEVVERRCEV